MKKHLYILLLILPLIGISQSLQNTVWKITSTIQYEPYLLQEEDLVGFMDNGTWWYKGVTPPHRHNFEGSGDEFVWSEDNRGEFEFTNGFSKYTGSLNKNGTEMVGYFSNNKGLRQTFTGVSLCLDSNGNVIECSKLGEY